MVGFVGGRRQARKDNRELEAGPETFFFFQDVLKRESLRRSGARPSSGAPRPKGVRESIASFPARQRKRQKQASSLTRTIRREVSASGIGRRLSSRRITVQAGETGFLGLTPPPAAPRARKKKSRRRR